MVLFFKHSYNIIRDKGLAQFFKRLFKYSAYLIYEIINHLRIYFSKIFTLIHNYRLRNILSKSENRTLIIILGTHSWFYPMFQRPPQLAKALSKKNCTVFYVFKHPSKNVIRGFYEVTPDCYLSFRLDLLLKLKQKKIFYTVSYDINTQYQFISELAEKGNQVIYDYLDEIHPDINQTEINEIIIDKHLNILSDERFIVLATAEKLYQEAEAKRIKNIYLIPNAADIEHFSQIKEARFSKSFNLILSRKKPVIGSYGTIAKWIDFELLIYLAQQRKDYEFVIIGLIGDNSIYEYKFENIKNLTFHKPIQYRDLPAYARMFDVSIIPFRKYSVTEATSPIKLFEYMAIGKPIVSTDLTECKKYESVLIAENFSKFAEILDNALLLKKDDIYFEKMKKESAENSWTNRADRILEIINGRI